MNVNPVVASPESGVMNPLALGVKGVAPIAPFSHGYSRINVLPGSRARNRATTSAWTFLYQANSARARRTGVAK